MMVIEHGGNTIEPKAIKTILLHPPAQVGQEKSQHLPARRHTNTHTSSYKAPFSFGGGDEGTYVPENS